MFFLKYTMLNLLSASYKTIENPLKETKISTAIIGAVINPPGTVKNNIIYTAIIGCCSKIVNKNI
jgi:hypothetical protein